MDHATLNRWVICYSSSLALAAKKRIRTVATSWRIDETTIKIKGKWVYLYRAVDKFADTIDFMLSEHRDEAAETPSSNKQSTLTDLLKKSSWIKAAPTMPGWHLADDCWFLSFIEIGQVKYLNNLIEQDHRVIKTITKPMMGFKALHSAKPAIEGIETAHIIQKGQLSKENIPAYKQFMALAE